MDLTAQCREFEAAVLAVDRLRMAEIYQTCGKQASPLEISDLVLVPALESIGRAWEEGRAALSEVYMASRLCEELLESVTWPTQPLRQDFPPVALAVFEDYHMLGKRILKSVVRSAGFEVLDYGRANKDEVLERVQQDKVQFLMLSTLMLRSALCIRELKDEFEKRGIQSKVIVGGAPFRFDQKLWRKVGADAMGLNPTDAVQWLQSHGRASKCEQLH